MNNDIPKDDLYAFIRTLDNSDYKGLTITDMRELLSQSIENGEVNELDFKSDWISSDKLAKIILAFANYGGGFLIFGVREDEGVFKPIGLEKVKDKTDVIQGLETFLPDYLIKQINIKDYHYEDSEYKDLIDKKFQVLSIKSEHKNLPYLSIKESQTLHRNRIYTRRGASNEEANNDEINEILTRKLEALYSHKKEIDLEIHIKQLKELYNHISRTKTRRVGGVLEGFRKQMQAAIGNTMGYEEVVKNENYPELGFEEFISECITGKQKRIQHELDI